MPRRKKKTWIVVLDGGEARIYRALGANGSFELEYESRAELRSNREIETDRPGRVRQRTTSARSAIDSVEDAHRREKFQFVRHIAERIDRAAESGAFDQLVVMAPPQALGDLRSVLGPRSRDALAAEVTKNLTGLPLAEIETYVANALRP